MTPEQIESLPIAELRAAFGTLLAEFAALQQRFAALEAENKELRQRLDKTTNSRNSSQPPARDQKTNQPKKKRRKHGPPRGHQKYERPLVDEPDQIIQVPVTECTNCLADLSNVAPEDFVRRQITELPVVKPLVLETRQHQVTCPHCDTLNRGTLPTGLETDRYFGSQLAATVIYYKQAQHLSYERIVATLRELHGVTLSEGSIAAILQRAGEQAQPVAEQIKEQVLRGLVVRSDETSARVQGRNWWHWVFLSEHGIYHTVQPTRSAAVIEQIVGAREIPVWVCDCYGAQLTAPAMRFQLCLAHQLRDLQRVLELVGRQAKTAAWATALQELFTGAIHLRNRFLGGALTLTGLLRRSTQSEKQLDKLLAQPVFHEAAQKLQRRFVRHRDKLLTFLQHPDIPPTNNEAERALRPSVIQRKVTNGFRSQWGAKSYAALQTVLATAAQKSKLLFQTLVDLMGTPVLPFFANEIL